MVVGALVASTIATVSVAIPASAAPSTVTQTFNYSAGAQSFTVPAGITQLTVSLIGGEGGLGGPDSTAPTPGGYKGVVSGTVDVTPGTVLSIGVGKGGTSGTARSGNSGNASAPGGTNPLGGYAGGAGGIAGNAGSSGNGAGGAAATVVTFGSTTLVAGGGGGNGGSGQFAPLTGRPGEATYKARLDGVVSTTGQVGLDTMTFCAPLTSCDGGASGGGGGGAGGGARGAVEYGAGSATEYFGYGGFPGSSSTAGLGTLSAIYQYYSTNANNGSFTVSYATGSPAAPTAVAGTAADAAVALSWVAPTNTGGAAITDYTVEYSSNGGTSWSTFSDGVSTATTTTVSGLTNGTAYVFRVTAVNSFGAGNVSATSSPVTPSAVPSAPTIGTITPGNGTLTVPVSGITSYSPILGYEYSVDNGAWFNANTTTSPITVPGLTNGTSYAVRIRAYSAIGTGAASDPKSGTPAAVPGAPSITSATTGADRAVVAFAAGSTGGLPITGYEYQLNGGSWVSAGTTTSPLTITGLTDATSYSVQLRALNALGAGAASPAVTLTTSSVPGAPTVTSINPGDRSLSVSFTPAATGGLSISGYEYQLTSSGPWVAASSTASPLLISSLTNGTGYPVRLRATNAVGTGPASTAVTGTPRTIPGAPTIGAGSYADGKLSVGFTAPTNDGGAAITTYQYSTDGGSTWRTRDDGLSGSPISIATLSSDGTTPVVDGTDYPVEVRAVNSAGAGTASGIADVGSRTAPTAPVIQTVTGRDSSLLVTIVPAPNGGASIDKYEYRLDSGPWTDTGTLGNWFSVTGLTNGVSRAVQVRALNSVGASDPSAAVSGTPRTTPGTAVISAVTPIDRALQVAVSVPSDGGSAVTDWEYTTDGGSTWASAGSSTSPLTLSNLSSNTATRLSNGASYPIAVRARNAAGLGGASATVSASPSATPSSPTITVTPQNGRLQVGYTISSDGGSPITDVQYRLDGGTWTTTGSTVSPFVIGGLTNGTSYTVEVRGVNTRGNGSGSTVATGVPRTVPDAPTGVTVTSANGSAAVSWTAPVNNGGSTVTGYTATAWSAATGGTAVSTCTSAGLTCTVTGLTNSTPYYVSVVATNAAGTGGASSPRVAVTPAAKPSAPTITGITPANTYLTVAFTAGAAGTSLITGYEYQLNGGAWTAAPAGTSSPITLSGLTNGTAYAVDIRAISASGAGATSNTVTATPYTLPDIPNAATISGTGANGSVTVQWVAPANNGSPITGYGVVLWSALTLGGQSYTCNPGTALTCTISGLSNGTTYYATVDATNAAGTTVRSSPRVPVAAGTAPGAPTTVAGTAGDGQVALTWNAGTAGTGAAVTDYAISYSSDGVTYTPFADGVSTTRAATVTGLTNGTAYTFKVQALSPSGSSPASAASAAVTPTGTGTTPTFGGVTRTADGFTTTIANWNASTTYTLAATNGGTATNTGAAVTVTGLAPGAASTVTVSAARPGYTTVSGTVSGAALAAGTAPTFGPVTRQVGGYTVSISNFDPSGTTYTQSVTSGTVSRSGAVLTVSGLAAGASADVTVTAAHAGATNASGTVSGTALPAGTAATFGPVTQLADGFTVDISNFDADSTYTATASAGTVSRTGSTLTVTGLAASGSSTVSVIASKTGFAPATGSVTGTALAAGTTPVLSPTIGTPSGFTFDISNFDAGTTYAVTTSSGNVSRSDTSIVVTGLAPGTSATVTVTASRAGYTTTSATATGTALQAGTAPTVSASTSTVDGYYFDITNRISGAAYTFTATAGTVSRMGNRVTVTGLAAAQASDVTISVYRPGYAVASTTTTGSALLAGTAPTIGETTRTADGFGFDITNFDGDTTYTLDTTAGTVARVGSRVTITGLAPGAAAIVTIKATRAGYSPASTILGNSALSTGTTPSMSPPVRSIDGFTTTIDNLDEDAVYTLTTTAGAVSRVGSTVTVTGLAPGAVATVTVAAAKSGFTDTSADVTGAALETGTTPTFSAVTSTADGFTVEITDYDADVTYAVSADAGTVVRSGALLTVTGLDPGAAATITVDTTRDGFTPATASVSGAALGTGTAPTLSDVTRLTDGFSFDIVDPDGDTDYVVSTSAGTVTRTGATVTVSGLAAGETADVTVTAYRPGFTAAATTVSGAALETGTVPTFSAVVQTVDGFTVDLTNLDADTDYTVTTTAGTVSRDGSAITVAELAPGAAATVTVAAAKSGFTGTSADVAGAALGAGATPSFLDVMSTSDGFAVEIANYNPAVTYTVSTSAGTIVRSDAFLLVSGLAPGASATVTVSATRDGFTPASATVTGRALKTGTAPTFSSVTRLADGFSFDITNPDVGTDYVVDTSAGTVTRTGSTVVVRGLTAGQSAEVTVTAYRPGYSPAAATLFGAALETGTVPTFSDVTQTGDGFTVDLTNLDPDTDYALSTTAGVVNRSGATLTVTGLTPGQTATVSVTATRGGFTGTTGTVTGSALSTGGTLTFATVERLGDGFRVGVLGLDPDTTYTAASSIGTASLVGGILTVTGLAPGVEATATVTGARSGFTTVTATVTGAALATGSAPTFGPVTRTDTGYTVEITDLDPDTTYTYDLPAGVSATRVGALLTIAGLAPGASADVVVTASRAGFTDATATVSGTALSTGTAPVLSNVTPLADGFTFTIDNLDPDATYEISTTAGTVNRIGNTVTVSGLTPGSAASVAVTVSTAGSTPATGSISGTALGSGATPTFSGVAALVDGFSAEITNFDAGTAYTLTPTAGTAILVGSTVTVSGLAPGASATVSVLATAPGATPGTGSVTGTALETGGTPGFSAATQLTDGFSVQIVNFDPDTDYVLATSAGTVTRVGSTITVSGLTPGTPATVTVTANRAGHTPGQASVSSTALAIGSQPTVGAATPATDGFTVDITNLDPNATYSLVPTAGTATLIGSTITVTGLAPGSSASVTVTANRPGFTSASAAVTAAALELTVTVAGGGATLMSSAGDLTLSGTTDAPPGTTVTVTVAGRILTTIVGADGTWTLTTDALPAGQYDAVVSVTVLGVTAITTQHLTVLAATGDTPTTTTPDDDTPGTTTPWDSGTTPPAYLGGSNGPLAYTGVDTRTPGLVGSALFVVGSLLLLLSRRRRGAHAAGSTSSASGAPPKP